MDAIPKAPDINPNPSPAANALPSASEGADSAQTLKKSFAETVAPASNGVSPLARFTKDIGSQEPEEQGKSSISALADAYFLPNDEMLKEIAMEKDRLSKTAIFFACINVEKCPLRKFLNDWFNSLWNIKLVLKISFCRQIQRGLFIIFFQNHESQLQALN